MATTVNILGTEYKIKRKRLMDADYDGYCDPTNKLIIVRKDNYNKVGDFDYLIKKQLRHEIIHAFLSESGLQSNYEHSQRFGHDETMVDWVAIQFPKMLETFKKLNVL